jgi:hypothetical protein
LRRHQTGSTSSSSSTDLDLDVELLMKAQISILDDLILASFTGMRQWMCGIIASAALIVGSSS